MDGLSSAMDAIAGETKVRGEHKKHYIPFSTEEFDKLRVAFKRTTLTPNDVKLVLMALAAGKLDIVVKK